MFSVLLFVLVLSLLVVCCAVFVWVFVVLSLFELWWVGFLDCVGLCLDTRFGWVL